MKKRLLARLTLGILHAPSVHKDKGSARLLVPAVLLNPSRCTLTPTGMHVNALCNLAVPRNRKLQNVKAPARHSSTHKTPSFASLHVPGYKQRPGRWEQFFFVVVVVRLFRKCG